MDSLTEIVARAQEHPDHPLQETQARLTRRWIEPVLPEILQMVRRHRQAVDEQFQIGRGAGVAPLALADGEAVPALYPVGYCQYIRDAVWKRLQGERLFGEFRRHGLALKKIYFIQTGAHFQNAIQLGEYLLDVAHNTVEAGAEPVMGAPFDQEPYENLDDWLRYAAIAESYYHCRLFPNTFFPLIFPLAPFSGHPLQRPEAGFDALSRPALSP